MQIVSESSFHGTLAERIRRQFFYSVPAGIVSVGVFAVILYVLIRFVDWALLNSVLSADPEACRQASGACWGFVTEKWRLILFGRFPYAEQWRPGLATAIVIALLVLSAFPAMWHKPNSRYLLWGWGAGFVAFFALMTGGVFGLSHVSTDMWGGLPLTVILTLFGMGLSIPIGVVLAVARRSSMPIVSGTATGYIELVRGVPLITVLFVSTFIFPLLLPSGFRVDAFWRVTVGIVLFQAAYIAETVRGGIQTIPAGQFNAGASLGLTKFQVYSYIILPQALVAVIPAFINSLLSCFMDTSLVTVVSMTDLTGALKLALGDAVWRGYFVEGYVFIAVIYFVISFGISRYSMWLEGYLGGNKRR